MAIRNGKDDGGPAFPLRADDPRDVSQGMSLRDYFAGQVIGGMFADGSSYEVIATQAEKNDLRPTVMAARVAYSVADAMIAEGKK